MAEAFAKELGLPIEGDLMDAEDDVDESDADLGESMDERTRKISQLEQQCILGECGLKILVIC